MSYQQIILESDKNIDPKVWESLKDFLKKMDIKMIARKTIKTNQKAKIEDMSFAEILKDADFINIEDEDEQFALLEKYDLM